MASFKVPSKPGFHKPSKTAFNKPPNGKKFRNITSPDVIGNTFGDQPAVPVIEAGDNVDLRPIIKPAPPVVDPTAPTTPVVDPILQPVSPTPIPIDDSSAPSGGAAPSTPAIPYYGMDYSTLSCAQLNKLISALTNALHDPSVGIAPKVTYSTELAKAQIALALCDQAPAQTPTGDIVQPPIVPIQQTHVDEVVAAPVDDTGITQPPIVPIQQQTTPEDTTTTSNTSNQNTGNTTPPFPNYGADYSTLSCEQLNTLAASLTAAINNSSTGIAVKVAYSTELSKIQTALLTCSPGSGNNTGNTNTGNTNTGNTNTGNTNTGDTTPTDTISDKVPVTPVYPNINFYPSVSSMGGSGSGSGNADGASAGASSDSKKLIPWWWVVIVATLGIAAYRTEKMQ